MATILLGGRSRRLMAILVVLLPWPLRRVFYRRVFGYQIAPSARIGLSIIQAHALTMGERSRIGHFNTIGPIDRLVLNVGARIGTRNRIAGMNSLTKSHFSDEIGRPSELILGEQAAVVSRHFFDCCNSVKIGAYATLAGEGTQIFTHGIDIKSNRQRSGPVVIGDYTMIGTGCVILKGAHLPDRSILAAGSTLRHAYTDEQTVYEGVPATPRTQLSSESLYFIRRDGHVL